MSYADEIHQDEIKSEISDTTTEVETPVKNSKKKKYKSVKLTKNFKKLKSINPDTVGWLKVNGTRINYPVVKRKKNNKFYMNHDFFKNVNSAGWVFVDYRNDISSEDVMRKNTVIYGHAMLNRTMFGSLRSTLQPYWYKNKRNHFITLDTPDYTYTYEVFAVYRVKAEKYYLKTLFTDASYEKYIRKAAKRSKYNFDNNVGFVDKILTLSTCSGTNNYRLVVQAKLVNVAPFKK